MINYKLPPCKHGRCRRATGGGRRGTMRTASEASWRPAMKCAFPGPDSYAYALLFLFFSQSHTVRLITTLYSTPWHTL